MKDGPAYNTSKRQLWLAFTGAWIVIFLIVVGGLLGISQAVDLASIVVPSMIMLIAAMLGIHRITGSMDFRAAQEHAADVPAGRPPYDARAEPGNAP